MYFFNDQESDSEEESDAELPQEENPQEEEKPEVSEEEQNQLLVSGSIKRKIALDQRFSMYKIVATFNRFHDCCNTFVLRVKKHCDAFW